MHRLGKKNVKDRLGPQLDGQADAGVAVAAVTAKPQSKLSKKKSSVNERLGARTAPPTTRQTKITEFPKKSK